MFFTRGRGGAARRGGWRGANTCGTTGIVADRFVFLWPLGLSVFVVAAFAFTVIRGLRSGKLWMLGGMPVDRDRYPAMFWLVTAIYVVGGGAILYVAFDKFWQPFMGR